MMPSRLAFVLAVLCLLPGPAGAKPKHCLTEAEIKVEQEVRHGVFLREASRRCGEELTPGTKQTWDGFAEKSAEKFNRATDRRAKVYQREYEDIWQRQLTYSDGRMVTYYRHFPLTRAYCENVKKLLDGVARRGYGAFAEQAATVQNEVLADYKICR